MHEEDRGLGWTKWSALCLEAPFAWVADSEDLHARVVMLETSWGALSCVGRRYDWEFIGHALSIHRLRDQI